MNDLEFSDPALQAASPQAEILRYLEELTDRWGPIRRETAANESAARTLLVADGMQVRHGDESRKLG